MVLLDKELLLLALKQSKVEPFLIVQELKEATSDRRVESFLSELNQLGIRMQITIDNNYQITREQRAQLAIFGALNGFDFEKIIKELSWQEFEILTTIVGDEFGYIATKGLNFSTNERKYQIDVFLKNKPYLLLVDCKHFGGTGKQSVLKNAAEEQITRAKAVSESLDSLGPKLSIKRWKKIVIIPMIVTWLDDDLIFHEGVPVVPFMKLRSFFQNFYLYIEDIHKIIIQN